MASLPTNPTFPQITLYVIVTVCWVVGCVLAKGFFSTLFAIFFPPWGWYLIAEAFLRAQGIT